MSSRQPQRPASVPRDAAPLRPVRWLWPLLGVLLGLSGWRLWEHLHDPHAYPIRKLTVDGEFRFLARESIQQLVGGAVSGGFFEVNVQQVRRMILREPWVREASVTRVWPDTIHVSIREQQPVARWGKDGLLSTTQEVFSPDPASFPPGLIRLYGPSGSEAEVWTTYRRANVLLGELGLKIGSLALSDRRAWQIVLSDGSTLLLGRHFTQERLERFIRAWPRILRENWTRVQTLDLRYTNGFAVKERPTAPSPATPGTKP